MHTWYLRKYKCITELWGTSEPDLALCLVSIITVKVCHHFGENSRFKNSLGHLLSIARSLRKILGDNNFGSLILPTLMHVYKQPLQTSDWCLVYFLSFLSPFWALLLRLWHINKNNRIYVYAELGNLRKLQDLRLRQIW